MGLYPALPGHRMAYDADGTAVLNSDGTSIAVLSSGQAQGINNESGAIAYTTASQFESLMILIFPENRDIVGYVCEMAGNIATTLIETSTNTTTGLDGTWTGHGSISISNTSAPAYRTINALSLTGVKAIRFNTNSGGFGFNTWKWSGVHIYGQPSSGQNPDSLRVYDSTGTSEVGGDYFDFNEIQRTGVSSIQFTIHNLSSTKTATTLVVSMPTPLTDASPTLVGQYQFSLNGVTYGSSVTFASLAPGATTATIWIRDTVNSGAALSVWAARLTTSYASYA